MRIPTFRSAIAIGLAVALAGCSATSKTSDKSSWWPSALSFKSKSDAASSTASTNAPSAPTFGSTATAAPTVSMPGAGYSSSPPNYYGGTQYPVTPYPPTTVPGAAAAYSANVAPAAGNYMPPTDPYGGAPGNPYAATTANPYAASPASAHSNAPANPYGNAAGQSPAYTAGGQYNSAPYPAGPSTSGDSPYAYR